jgi:hypothetical protein
MHSYHNVAKLRQIRGACHIMKVQSPKNQTKIMGADYSVTSTIDLNVQVSDFLPQCIAVEA